MILKAIAKAYHHIPTEAASELSTVVRNIVQLKVHTLKCVDWIHKHLIKYIACAKLKSLHN